MTKYFKPAYRDGDQVKRRYIGKTDDPLVEFLYREDRLRKAQRKADSQEGKAEIEFLNETEHQLLDHRDHVALIVDMWLATQGRGLFHKSLKIKNAKTRFFGGQPMPRKMTKTDFEELVTLAEQGHDKALESLRSIIASDRETWGPVGDLFTHVKQRYLQLLTRNNLVGRECLEAKLDETMRQLCEKDDSPIRRLVAQQAILGFLDFHYHSLQSTCAGRLEETKRHHRRMDRAQKRYAASLELLARIDQLDVAA